MKAGEGWLCFISPLLSQVNQLWLQIHPLRSHHVSHPQIEKYFNTIHGDLTLSFSEKGEVGLSSNFIKPFLPTYTTLSLRCVLISTAFSILLHVSNTLDLAAPWPSITGCCPASLFLNSAICTGVNHIYLEGEEENQRPVSSLIKHMKRVWSNRTVINSQRSMQVLQLITTFSTNVMSFDII